VYEIDDIPEGQAASKQVVTRFGRYTDVEFLLKRGNQLDLEQRIAIDKMFGVFVEVVIGRKTGKVYPGLTFEDFSNSNNKVRIYIFIPKILFMKFLARQGRTPVKHGLGPAAPFSIS
jgi:hypothetical protein